MNKSLSILNAVLGPLMRGPSSSHAVAPHGIAKTIRSLSTTNGEIIVKAEVRFDPSGSFARVYSSQGADEGFASGFLGLDISSADYLAASEKLQYKKDTFELVFSIKRFARNNHPNSVEILLICKCKDNTERQDLYSATSTGGGMFIIHALNNCPIEFDAQTASLWVKGDASSADLTKKYLYNKGILIDSKKVFSGCCFYQVKRILSDNELAECRMNLKGIRLMRQAPATFREEPSKYWKFEQLKKAPKYRCAGFADSDCKGLKTILFDGVPVNGKKSPVFAYIGYPKGPVSKGGFPGIVLVHGGGGTAFPKYVRLWNKKGFAVIALDWYNRRPIRGGQTGNVVKQVPLGGGTRVNHVATVGNMVLCSSLLRTLPKVNPDKIALVGLSWGSWYGAMVASVDPRLKGVIEIYCGDCTPKRKHIINGRFHHAARVPMYWVAGTNDGNVTPKSLQLAFNECPKIVNKSMVINLPHSHAGFTFDSCFRMANHFLNEAPSLPKLGKAVIKDGVISIEILNPGKGITEAILCYTCDSDEKVARKRVWKSIFAKFDEKTVFAKLPAYSSASCRL
jgi:iron-sulfur-dependent L-serine dehydratase beta subunit